MMRGFGKALLSCGLAALLSACTSTQDFRVDAITSLTEPDPNAVSFNGLEFLADTIPGQAKPRVNIIYLHGIGWTQDPDQEALGQDFLQGMASAYNQEAIVDTGGKCLRETQGPEGARKDKLYITTPEPLRFETGIPGSYVTLSRLACVDKQVVPVSDTLDVAVYRIFWDDIFWNAVQFAHVGQDDARGSSAALAGLRRKHNRRLKDELVNYGFSDAVMYLGETGTTIRQAVRGAICAAALDAGGVGFDRQGIETAHTLACSTAGNTRVATNRFAFVSESLGSKITYDLLREALTDGQDGPLDRIVRGSEVFMLANQIPLLSLSDMTTGRTRAAPSLPVGERPTIIALSEVNDFLTYEIMPFLEQLWSRSEHQDSRAFNDPGLRSEIASRLGFDIVDMRVIFADPLVPFLKGFVDPLQAHKEHAREEELMRIILCGVENGVMREAGCLAAENR